MMFRAMLLSFLAVTATVEAADWPQWRGPLFNGSTDETDLPNRFSRTENVAWKTTLPGCSAATPIVVADRVFISGVDAAAETLLASCYDRGTGKLLWRHKLARGVRRDYRSTYAAPSPVTDGKIVVFFYSNGDLICYDLDGKEIWSRNIQEDYGTFAFLWTFASSPTLSNGKLYLQVFQRDVPVDGRGFAEKVNRSYLLAMDPATGKTLWRRFRPSKAVAESREAFSTPIPFSHDGREELLVVGGDAMTGHNAATGEELWRWGDMNPVRISHWRLVPSPVAGDGVILACAPKRSPVYAIKAGAKGLLGEEDLGWTSRDVREVSSDVPTPAFYDGDFFILSDVRRALSRVEPATGKVKWTITTPGSSKYEASPTVADGKAYLVNFDGEVSIVDTADGNVLETIPMDEPSDGEVVRSTIVVAGRQLFIRTTRELYCIGE